MKSYKKTDNFINRYSISKTLQFRLIPVGDTEVNFSAKKLLEEDQLRADNYKKMKNIIDEYHKKFIDDVLSRPMIIDIKEYAELYYKSSKTDKDKKTIAALEDTFRKQIASAFTSHSDFKKLNKKELFEELLPAFIEGNEEYCDVLSSFSGFITYFTGFFENRNNMYSAEDKSTSIAYRCINDNLPKFLDNCRSFEKIRDGLDSKTIKDYSRLVHELYRDSFDMELEEIFSPDYFGFVLSQHGISIYNQIIGGRSYDKNVKIQGLNELINLHNQKTGDKLPKLKMLYKQILSDRETLSFIPESFTSDDQVLGAVNSGYRSISEILGISEKIFADLSVYDSAGIYIKNEYISDISVRITGLWSAAADQWNAFYDSDNLDPKKPPKNPEKYYEKRKSAYSANKSFSIADIQKLINAYSETHETLSDDISIIGYYERTVSENIKTIRENYGKAEILLTEKYDSSKKLMNDDISVALIKNLLDSIKELEHIIKQMMGTGKEEYKDEVFYGNVQPVYDGLREFDRLYDQVRNYVTKKPYSKDKIKLNFQNPQFLNGWDRNKEKDYRSVLLRKGNDYYLVVMDKASNRVFEEYPEAKSGGWQKINYKLLPGPNKMLPKVFFAASNIELFAPSEEILRIRKNETFKKGANFNKRDCEKFIDFFKESLDKHEEWRDYGFSFRNTKDYNDIGEFYNDVRMQGYKITYTDISEEYLMDMVSEGKIYLFRIYNKDFSEYSKGTPNLHTLYLRMVFDERNLNDVVYQLNGGAEMFYRLPSLRTEDTAVHKANEPIKNKNPLNKNETSKFEYDIIKDRRFTRVQFSLHVPITLNFKSQGMEKCNTDVRKALRECKENYVIGIDRGERHLLYVCVINGKGQIVEQMSLNTIVNEHNGNTYKTDYHAILDDKEKERQKARKNWTSIENIKDIKEGYISQAVHKICQLVIKYDAVIAMEDLNAGFKNSRVKVEKQVYQKFEKMLIDKLNYLVADKNGDPERPGGLLKAYQLTEKFTSFRKMGKQNGFIFYIPAWLTSKIDPVTGFVDLLKPKYESIEKSKSMISAFDFVRYNSSEDLFEIGIDYSKIGRANISYIKKWTVCTNGERIRTFRNKDKNNEFDSESVILTKEFGKLLKDYDIAFSDNEDILTKILEQDQADFFRRFTELLRLTLQMRNSITNSDTDYLISPVRDSCGTFYCSEDHRNNGENAVLPANADANGAYNIARKAMWCIEQIKAADADKLDAVRLAIKNEEWLRYTQGGE